MKPETGSSVSKAKTEKKANGGVLRDSVNKKKSAKRQAKTTRRRSDTSVLKNESALLPENKTAITAAISSPKHVSDLEFLDTVKETVYKKLLDNELDLKIDSGFKAIELKNKISDTSENERLLLEILSEIRSEELSK